MKTGQAAEPVTPMLEISDLVFEVGGRSLLDCMHCGTCTAVCPWGLVGEYNPRLLLRQIALGLEGFEQESLWRCLTCRTCVQRCPREIDIIDAIRSARAVTLESSGVPPALRAPLGSTRSEGNPWGLPREQRSSWIGDLDVPELSAETEQLFFACCTHAYDGRNQPIVGEIVSLLLQGGVGLGVIGNDESCCGDQAHSCGGLSTFAKVRDGNERLFESRGVANVITTSPHCMETFNSNYGGRFRARHYTEVLSELLGEGALEPIREVPLRVAFHDPCYLGRHGGIYEPPRSVLKNIPGLELVELPRNRAKSLCCGGGGGGAFREAPVEERLSVLRVREALSVKVDVIATACPYCTIMLEDGVNASGLGEGDLRVLDVAELLSESLGDGG